MAELETETRWDHVLSASPDKLDRLAKEAPGEYSSGWTEALDPDKL